MAILIEGISVVIRVDTLIPAFESWPTFVSWVPNQTLCSDGELARIGFMSPSDVAACISDLEERGIQYLQDRQAQDVAVVDQLHGLSCVCDWIEVGTMPLNGDITKPVMAARLIGSTCDRLMYPAGWTYEKSLTQHYRFVPTSEVERAFRQVNNPDSRIRTFVDADGKEWFLGRTHLPKT